MKKYIISAAFLCLGLGFTGCSDDEKGPAPTSIDSSTLTYKKVPGGVVIKWAVPQDANYKYVKVTYQIPGEEQQRMRLASVYSDSILIDNLLARYGEIDFQLQPFSADEVGGEMMKVTAQAGPAKQTLYETFKDKVTLTADQLWADNPESSEGPLKDLIDGNENTYYHMSWSAPTPFPHYIVVDMGQEVTALQFSYICRNNRNRDNPKEMDVLASTTFNKTKDETGTWLLKSFSGLPDTQKATYETNATIKSDKPFRYVWFKVKSSTSGGRWVAMAEWAVYKIRERVFDPEVNEITEVKYY